MNKVKLTSYLTGLPVSVDPSEIDCYRGGNNCTTLYFKDDSTALVSEDFETVDALIEALKKEGKS